MLNGWHVVYNGMSIARAGVAIVMAPHIRLMDIEHIMEGRMTMVRVKANGVKLVIYSCYCPTEEHSTSSKETFYRTLHRAIQKMRKEHPSYTIIAAGDFNTTIGQGCNHETWIGVGPYHDEDPTSFNGTKLLETAECNKLYILNTMFATRSHEHRWSFHSNLGYKRRLDYIIADWYVKRATTNCRVYPMQSQIFDSDHRIVVRRSRSPTRPDIRKLSDDLEIQGKYSAKLDALLLRSEEKEENFRELDEVEGRMTEAILEASQETIPSKSKREMDKPWTNPTYQELTQRFLSEKGPIKRKALYYETRKIRTELKNNHFKTKADQLNFAGEQRDTEQEFRTMREHTSTPRFNRLLITNQKLEEHFSTHFSDRKCEPQPELEQPESYPNVLPPDDVPAIDDSVPERGEVESSIKKLKNGKCQGTGKIYAEQLKYSRSSGLLNYMVLLIGLIWSCPQVPGKWLTANITCLHKKGLKSMAENYRGLSIIATISKVLSAIIVERIREAYEYVLLRSQCGFRANRSTTDAIYILRQLLENTRRVKEPMYIAFVDLKAAYDWIPRDALFKCLEIRLRSPLLVSILRALYTGTKAYVKGSKHLFDTLVGCRQGALESPVLFNIYMDFVVRVARQEVLKERPDLDAGMKVEYCIPNEVSPREYRSEAPAHGTTRITELLYADDEAIFANSIEELKIILEIYDRTFVLHTQIKSENVLLKHKLRTFQLLIEHMVFSL